jgi:hypothetical protein
VRYVAVAQMPWIDPPQSLVLRAAPAWTRCCSSARRRSRVAPESRCSRRRRWDAC